MIGTAGLGYRIAGTTHPVALLLVETRALRGFADGLVSVVLAGYLVELGFGAGQIGWITTMTLIGSAAAAEARASERTAAPSRQRKADFGMRTP